MLFFELFFLFEISSLAAGAVLHPFWRHEGLQLNEKADCSVVTINNYVTVTVTDTTPGTVTVAVPDWTAISSSLASASTIDSIVVVENSQNRPVDAPPNTVVPTFIHSIYAPAIEVTEAAHTGNSAVYLPDAAHQTTVVLSTITESIIISPIGGRLAAQNATQSTGLSVSTAGWNSTGSQANGTGIVATTAALATASPSYKPYDHAQVNALVGRQTCVMVSAVIGGVWASWCNNWDGSTVLSYTSWVTTLNDDTRPNATTLDRDSVTSTLATTTTHPITSSPVATMQTQVSTPPVSTPVSTACGQLGPFNVTFDDLPKQSVSDEQNAALPPIFNPFDHFYWDDGWSYAPPPSEPYSPHDGTLLGVYVPVTTGNNTSDLSPAIVPTGGFGAGPRSSTNAYWFSSESAWIGCENNVTDPSGVCDFVAEGYRWSEDTNTNIIHVTQHFTQPLCNSAICPLTQIFFNSNFTSLSAMSFYAKIGGSVHTFYVDDLQLTWWNNTCEAGNLRASSRK